jgi:TRAP-type C4-dicarboxylate transport system permease small subunit
MQWQDNLSRLASGVERGLGSVSRVMAIIAACVLAVMMLLTAVDVSGRYFFNKPIVGAWELIGLLLVCAGTWGFAYCQIQKHHIRVTFFFERFPSRLQAIFDSLAYLLGLGACSLICWQSLIMVKEYILLGDKGVSYTLAVVLWPFMLMLAIGAGMLAAQFLVDLLHSLAKAVRK